MIWRILENSANFDLEKEFYQDGVYKAKRFVEILKALNNQHNNTLFQEISILDDKSYLFVIMTGLLFRYILSKNKLMSFVYESMKKKKFKI